MTTFPIDYSLLKNKNMSKKYSYDELVVLKQEGKISWLEFVKRSEQSQDYLQWCKDHGVEPTDDNAELYLEMTDTTLMDGQELEDV
jgi:hypothetical protein